MLTRPGSGQVLADVRAQLDKKEDELKGLQKKLQSQEKETQKLKSQSRAGADKLEKDMETLEGKLNETRRSLEGTKKKLDQAEIDLKRANSEKDATGLATNAKLFFCLVFELYKGQISDGLQ